MGLLDGDGAKHFANVIEDNCSGGRRFAGGPRPRGDHRFFGSITIAPDTTLTCHKCKHECSVEAAVLTALEAGVVKKLSDHRVVGGGG